MKKIPEPSTAYYVRCARCGVQGWSSPAELPKTMRRPSPRACLTTRGGYPPMPDLFICMTCMDEIQATESGIIN